MLSLILMSEPASAQLSDSQFLERLESARKMYINGAYSAAERAFSQLNGYLDQADDVKRAEIESYKVLCAIALDKENATGMVKVFCDKYPDAPQQTMIKYTLGSRFFETGKYKEALEVFNSISKSHVYSNYQADYVFRKAYSNMCEGNLQEAGEGYEEIISLKKNRYRVPATYYRGYVHYCCKEFEKAIPLLEDVEGDARFSSMSRYYALECHFMLKDYDYVVKNGSDLFATLPNDLKASLARIMSEAYFEKGDNNSATYYFDIYKTSGLEFSRKDAYLSGILSYNMGSYKNAIESFSSVVGDADELTQNSYYYSAYCYLKSLNKVEALNCFRQASAMDFDKVIQEDAFFNFAKLSFDVNSDISQFDRYIEKYPESGKDDIIANYMAASFISSKNFRSAVDALLKVQIHSYESSSNLQKAAFFAAMQMVETRNYSSAISYLRTAQKNESGNQRLNILVRYWLAECCFRAERYDEAVRIDEELLENQDFRRMPEYPLAYYNLAYAYLRNKDYKNAQSNFERYIGMGTPTNPELGKDARIRLADTYFLLDDFVPAAERYEEIYNSAGERPNVYAALQAARSYANVGNMAKRIDLLRNVALNNKNHPLFPMGVYELGCAYAQNNQPQEATECFFTILGMENDSTFHAKSMLELASISLSARRYERAIGFYKRIVSEMPQSSEAQDALQGLESVYQTINRPEDFLSYIDQIGMSGIRTADEKEEMLFKSAENLYKAKRYAQALGSLQRYLSQYPEGTKVIPAMFYMAECLENTGRLEAASETYRKVMMRHAGAYQEPATVGYARVSFNLKNYEKAAEAYSTLIASAHSEQSRTSAYMGRLRADYAAKHYNEVQNDASQLLTSPSLTPAMRREVNFKMAKAYQVSGERNFARSIFESLSSDVNDEFGAESKYIIIKDAYDHGDFVKVERFVLEFAESNTAQQYWVAKSYILLGDSYRDRDDLQQARKTYENLMEDYVPQNEDDDILDLVRERLNRIRTIKR